jgi:hypothetical protein
MIFNKLKNQLSQQMEKKASWEDVANTYDVPFFKGKTSKQISMLVSTWKKRGLPAKVELWIVKKKSVYLDSDLDTSHVDW